MEPQLVTAIDAGFKLFGTITALGAVGALLVFLSRTSAAFARMDEKLTTLVGEVDGLREAKHHSSNLTHAVAGRVDRLEHEIGGHETRIVRLEGAHMAGAG